MKSEINRLLAAAMLVALVPACDDATGADDDATVLTYDFAGAAQGWTAGFADYPVGEEEGYELDSGHRVLPAPLDISKKGLYLAGNNHSDDLLMFVKRRVDGLAPATSYRVRFEVEIATNAPRGCVGVGGAPGESVYVKVAASTAEPKPVADQLNDWRLNVDIGNQSADGANGITIGNVANTNADCSAPVFQLKRLNSEPKVLEVRTDAQGSLWLLAGIDSGFEATTRVWYTRLVVRLTPKTGA